MTDLVLASKSKRRSAILTLCGIRHRVIAPSVKEIFDENQDIISIVKKNSRLKAMNAADKSGKQSVIIGADTLVKYKNRILGKPNDSREAKTLLMDFPGHTMCVYTGMTVINNGNSKIISGYDKSVVNIANMGRDDLNRLFKLTYPYDKAGSFSVDGIGAIIFDNIKGSYFNILGLPMIKLRELLMGININILDFTRK